MLKISKGVRQKNKPPEQVYVDEAQIVLPRDHHQPRIGDGRLLTPRGEVALFESLEKHKQTTGRGRREAQLCAIAVRNQILEANLRLVWSVARGCSRSPQQCEEFYSEGYGILLSAIDHFDYRLGFRFSTYATHCLRRHFYRCLKRSQRRKEFPVGDLPADGERSHSFFDAVPAPVEDEPLLSPSELLCGQKLLKMWKSCLDHREQQVIAARYGLDGQEEPQSLNQVAARLGLSKERVRQNQQVALRKLQDLAANHRPKIPRRSGTMLGG